MTVKDSICGICSCSIGENTLFATLTVRELGAFKDVVRAVKYGRKKNIFAAGDKCNGLYIIRSGKVKLLKTSRDGREQIIKLLGPGDLLGLAVFNEAGVYPNTAVAIEDVELSFIGKDDFMGVLAKQPGIAAKVVAELGKELCDAYERIGRLGMLSAKEKLAHLICSLAREYGAESSGGTTLGLTISRLEIAELIGITQETSIRLLKGFKEDGIIEIKRKELIIKDMKKLAEIGGLV